MTLLITLLVLWGVLSVLGMLGAMAVCRSGHLEDVARGFDAPLPYPADGARPAVPALPAPRSSEHAPA